MSIVQINIIRIDCFGLKVKRRRGEFLKVFVRIGRRKNAGRDPTKHNQ